MASNNPSNNPPNNNQAPGAITFPPENSGSTHSMPVQPRQPRNLQVSFDIYNR